MPPDRSDPFERMLDNAEAERDRALAALWNIRMEAERATVDEPPGRLPSRVIYLALTGMGPNKRRAQELAASEPAPSDHIDGPAYDHIGDHG